MVVHLFVNAEEVSWVFRESFCCLSVSKSIVSCIRFVNCWVKASKGELTNKIAQSVVQTAQWQKSIRRFDKTQQHWLAQYLAAWIKELCPSVRHWLTDSLNSIEDNIDWWDVQQYKFAGTISGGAFVAAHVQVRSIWDLLDDLARVLPLFNNL